MGLKRRLARWVDAGLIAPQQAQRILEFESGRERPLLLYAVAGLGGLAIAIGFVSVIAANWDLIPGRVKIANDLGLLVAGGLLFARWSHRWPIWLRESALVVLYGLTMGSIALVGQVYQLGGSTRAAMGLWSLLTVPLMVLGRSGFVAGLWSLGLQVTLAVWLSWLAEYPQDKEGWALAIGALVPWLWLSVGRSRWLERVNPSYAAVFTNLGWVEVIVSASIGANAFYSDNRLERWDALWVGFAVGLVLTAWLWRQLAPTPAGRWGRWLLLLALLLTYVPARLSLGHWGIVAALAFLGLWLLVAVSAHRAGMPSLVNLATLVLAVRIVIVYFEVFGSLLSTGLGLIIGGLLTLFLVGLWWRKIRVIGVGGAGTEARGS